MRKDNHISKCPSIVRDQSEVSIYLIPPGEQLTLKHEGRHKGPVYNLSAPSERDH